VHDHGEVLLGEAPVRREVAGSYCEQDTKAKASASGVASAAGAVMVRPTGLSSPAARKRKKYSR